MGTLLRFDRPPASLSLPSCAPTPARPNACASATANPALLQCHPQRRPLFPRHLTHPTLVVLRISLLARLPPLHFLLPPPRRNSGGTWITTLHNVFWNISCFSCCSPTSMHCTYMGATLHQSYIIIWSRLYPFIFLCVCDISTAWSELEMMVFTGTVLGSQTAEWARTRLAWLQSKYPSTYFLVWRRRDRKNGQSYVDASNQRGV